MSKAEYIAWELEQAGRHDDAAFVRSLAQQRAELLEALKDMRNGWRYIRETHGDLYGVGWDRAEDKANAAITRAEAEIGKAMP